MSSMQALRELAVEGGGENRALRLFSDDAWT